MQFHLADHSLEPQHQSIVWVMRIENALFISDQRIEDGPEQQSAGTMRKPVGVSITRASAWDRGSGSVDVSALIMIGMDDELRTSQALGAY